jgi:hypothetical protein
VPTTADEDGEGVPGAGRADEEGEGVPGTSRADEEGEGVPGAGRADEEGEDEAPIKIKIRILLEYVLRS